MTAAIFSKKWDNLWSAYCLHFAYYNFCRIHRSIRVTPAMESGSRITFGNSQNCWPDMMRLLIRASVFALVCVASLLAQGPSRESYRPIKLEKITSYPEVPVYVYHLSGGLLCTMNTRLDAKEGSEIKIASDPRDWYVMDTDGKTYRCKYVVFGDGAAPAPQPKK